MKKKGHNLYLVCFGPGCSSPIRPFVDITLVSSRAGRSLGPYPVLFSYIGYWIPSPLPAKRNTACFLLSFVMRLCLTYFMGSNLQNVASRVLGLNRYITSSNNDTQKHLHLKSSILSRNTVC